MNADEPNLLKHLTEARTRHIPEGGLSTILFCGKMTRGEGDSASVMSLHKGFVEEELGDHNNEEVNVTGLLMIQVSVFKYIVDSIFLIYSFCREILFFIYLKGLVFLCLEF